MSRVVAGEKRHGNVVCDLDGVLYRGEEAIEGAGGALTLLADAGFATLFVTNNSTQTPQDVVEKIRRLTGYSTTASQVIGSAQAAAHVLLPDHPRTLVVGGKGINEALRRSDIPVVSDPEEAGAVVVGLDRDFTYHRLDMAAMAIRNGARFVAANTDVTFPGSRELHPGAGAIVAAIEAASGQRPVVAGKPHQPIRSLIAQRLVPGPVWVVGDRPETDLAMAKAEGWRSALVLSGIVTDPDAVPGELRPDLVSNSIVEFARTLSERRSGDGDGAAG